MIRRLVGVLWRPRTILAALVERPVWVGTWAFILIVWAVLGGWLLSTRHGPAGAHRRTRSRRRGVWRQLCRTSSIDRYWRNRRGGSTLTSGGRFLLNPVLTLAAAAGLWLVARAEQASARFSQALSIVVHASVVLLLGQLVATPLHYVRESLTSPLNLAAVLPLMEDGTAPTRFAGSLDLSRCGGRCCWRWGSRS